MKWNEINRLATDEKDLFDTESPSQDHLDRFKSKLDQRFKPNQPLHFIRWIAASVATILIVSGSLLYYANSKLSNLHKPVLSSTSVELNETELFYKDQINKELTELNQLRFPDPQQKVSVLHELSAMDQNYKQLKNELDKNPDDERLIHGIVEHYQVKLAAISQIINSLTYCQTNSKYNSHEQNI